MKPDPLAPQTGPSPTSFHNAYQQTAPSTSDELDAPPAYTPGTSFTPSHTSPPPLSTSPPSTPNSATGNTPLLNRESGAHQPGAPKSTYRDDESREERDPYRPQRRMSIGGEEEEDRWKKYDGQAGCCFSTTGGCCFSARGGGCFSDTEGCCFSTNKGCCFSDTEGCCFSSNKECCFSNSKG